jgi:hypothetical protein
MSDLTTDIKNIETINRYSFKTNFNGEIKCIVNRVSNSEGLKITIEELVYNNEKITSKDVSYKILCDIIIKEFKIAYK